MRSVSRKTALLIAALLAIPLFGGDAVKATPQPGFITTIAGGGVGDGDLATNAPVYEVDSVVSEPDGSFLLLATGSCRIRSVEQGVISTTVGNGFCDFDGDGGPAPQAMVAPRDIALAPDGALIVADTFNCRIRRVQAGVIATIAGNGTCQSTGSNVAALTASVFPEEITVDQFGTIFFVDAAECKIRKLEAGVISDFAGSSPCGVTTGDGGPALNARINTIDGMAAYGGDLYLATDCAVRVISGGTIHTAIGNGECVSTGDGGPAAAAETTASALAFTSQGDMIIAEYQSCRIRRVSSGMISTIAGTGICQFNAPDGPALTTPFMPSDITVTADDTVLIAEWDGCRVRELGIGGSLQTRAGNGTCSFYGEGGPALEASLFVRDLDLGVGDAVVFTDSDSCLIRKFEAGVVTTVAGTGKCQPSADHGAPLATSLYYPSAIAIAPNGDMYVGDQDPCRIRRITSTTVEPFANSGCHQIDTDAAGNVYYDFNCQLKKRSPSGTEETVPGVQACHSGIFLVAPDGSVYFTPQFKCQVFRAKAGVVTLVAGLDQGNSPCINDGDGGAATSARLGGVWDIAIDAVGNMYLSVLGDEDCAIRRIRQGVIERVAGDGYCYAPQGDDGPALEASITGAARILVTPDYRVLVGDVNRLRQIEPDDSDGDGVIGATDNCIAVANIDQLNTDRNYVDQSPPFSAAVDDKSVANSDNAGDACDSDDDNDGLSDADEVAGTACTTVTTNPLLGDTDGDRFLDGAECSLGTDPTASTSKPPVSACGATTDTDGDRLVARVEICFYGTDPTKSDTDGDRAVDGAKDGCEAASFNGDRIVNVADMGMLASAIVDVTKHHVNIDVNKDGVWNPADQGLVASFISPAGQCPG